MYHFNNALQYLRAFVFMVFYSVYVPMCVCVCRYNLMSMCVSIEGGRGGGECSKDIQADFINLLHSILGHTCVHVTARMVNLHIVL